ncbi:MAG TPA: hypothetical protein ENN72_04425 [Firmicutes bacterium]|jgi:predicted regulator of Ras-like GTPase activity (Roadblock/LC7/MglB family)|nr:hypothetical protein [Bacillota bacterium]
MDYKVMLDGTLKKVEGALIVSFCGVDGLGIASSTYPVLPPNLELGDAQVATFLVHKRDSLKQIGIEGFVEDITIAGRYVVLIRMVSEDYFVSMTCSQVVNVKKARYYLYLLAEQLRQEIT